MSATFTVVDANNSVHSTTTFEHEGSLFTSGSGFVDFETGRLFAYWTARPCKDPAYCATLKPHEHAHSQFDVTIGDGRKIADGVSSGFYKVHGFYGIHHYRYPVSFFLMEKEGTFTYWHGTGYGPGMYLRAKRSKRKGYTVTHDDKTRYRCSACPAAYVIEDTIRRHVRFYCRG
jgi:hypothetical protein